MNREELIHVLKKKAGEIMPRVVAFRRHLHKYPELSFQEENTAGFIEEKLSGEGISEYRRMVKTGITGIINGKKGDKCIALRADTDALPITETGSCEYASLHPGIMHACGHDVHSAALYGALILLNELRDHWSGRVKYIFQPGEEKLPGGASLMIREGVLKDPAPQGIIGQHVFPDLPAGKVGFRKGMYMASTDELYVTVTGKGGHAAMPATYNNPLVPAAAFIQEVSALIDNLQKPAPTVVAFGKIEGKGATNVIPEKVFLEGTFRTFNEEWRKEVHEMLKNKALEIGKRFGVTMELTIGHGYPFLINDEKLTARAMEAATELLGSENVTELDLRMTAEDFAWYTQEIPGCFYRLGTASADGRFRNNVHTSSFDIDESALETATALMAWLAINELGS